MSGTPITPNQTGAGAGLGAGAGAGLGPLAALIPKHFDDTLGALLLGGVFAMALWGITCVQTYTYFRRESRDWLYLKLTIGFLFALDTFDSALNIHILYYYMVSNYTNILALFKPVWSIIVHVAVTATSNFAIRTLFCHRVYRLSAGNLWLTGGIMLVSLTDLVVGYTITVKAFSIQSFLELEKLSSLMYLTFAAGTGSDLLLALSLTWLLHKSRTGFKRTDGLIAALVTYTVYTGLIVAVDAALGLILYIVMPNNFIFLGFYLLLSKLYLNSYLASMNARELLREKKEDLVSIHLSQLSGTRGRFDVESVPTNLHFEKSTSDRPTTASSHVAISVSTLVNTKVDDAPQRPGTAGSQPPHSVH